MKTENKFLIFTLFVISLIGCGGSTSKEQGNPKLLIWHALSSKDTLIINTAATSFETKYPELDIEVKFKGNDELLFKDFSSLEATDEKPDLIFSNERYISKLLEKDAFSDISKYFNDSNVGLTTSEKEDLNPVLIAQSTDFSYENISFLPYRSQIPVMALKSNIIEEYSASFKGYDDTWEGLFNIVIPAIKQFYYKPEYIKVYYVSNESLFISWLKDYSFSVADVYNGLNSTLPSGLFDAIDLFSSAYLDGIFETKETLGRSAYADEFLFKVDYQLSIDYYSYTDIISLPKTRGVLNSSNIPASSIFVGFIDKANLEKEITIDRERYEWLFYKELLNDNIQERIITNNKSLPLKKSSKDLPGVISYFSQDPMPLDVKIPFLGIENMDNIVARSFDEQSITFFDSISTILSNCFETASIYTPKSQEYHDAVQKIFKDALLK